MAQKGSKRKHTAVEKSSVESGVDNQKVQRVAEDYEKFDKELLRAECAQVDAATPDGYTARLDAVTENGKEEVAALLQAARLVHILTVGNEATKANAAEALLNLATGNADNRKAIAEADGIAPLVELVKTGQSAEAKAAICGHESVVRLLEEEEELRSIRQPASEAMVVEVEVSKQSVCIWKHFCLCLCVVVLMRSSDDNGK